MNSALLSLLQIADPMLPIGGYAHSAGLETYVQAGLVQNTETAAVFVETMLTHNIQYTDAAFVSLAYDAALMDNLDAVVLLDQECNALKLPREIREASTKLGMRLMKLFQPLCHDDLAIKFRTEIAQQNAAGHYCIAFGVYACALDIPKKEALTGFYYNTAAGMVTNCVKLIPLGQQDGQQILFSLQPAINKLVSDTMQPDRKLTGLCCPGFDIRSMQHEQLYSRLYMS